MSRKEQQEEEEKDRSSKRKKRRSSRRMKRRECRENIPTSPQKFSHVHIFLGVTPRKKLTPNKI